MPKKITKHAAKAKAPRKRPTAKTPQGPKPRPRGAKAPLVASQPARGPSRGDMLMEMLERHTGASIGEVVAAFGILPHSARALISVETRKRGRKAVRADGRYTVA